VRVIGDFKSLIGGSKRRVVMQSRIAVRTIQLHGAYARIAQMLRRGFTDGIAMSNRKSFTLLELAVVLVIVTILASMAVPRYAAAASRYRLDSAARRVAADLNLARRQARIRSTTLSASFDANTDRYVLVGMQDPDRPSVAYQVILSDPPYEVDLVSATFGASGVAVFNGFGRPKAGGSIVLSAGVDTRTIQVDADTGKASIQ